MKHIASVVGIALLGTSYQVLAANGIPDTGDIPRAEPPRKLPLTEPVEIKQQAKPAYKQPDAAKAIKIKIETFVFTGNASFSQEQLNSLLADYLNRDIGIQELNQATKAITAFYRQNGYFLAQAYLPAQDITENEVEIAVIEGTLDTLTVNSDDGLSNDFLSDMAAYRLDSGTAVSEKNLLRNVTLMNALPAIQAEAQLNPSDIVGSTDVEIGVTKSPRFQGYLGANTYGNPFTKREVIIAGASWNNPAGRGDRISLNLKRSRDNGQRGFDLGYVVPIHASGTLLNLRYNYIDYKLGGEFKALKAEGDSQYFDIGIDQPILRDARKGLSLQVSGSYKKVNDEVKSIAFENRRNVVAANIGLAGDWLNVTGDISYQLGANVRPGRVLFQDDIAKALDQGGAKTAGGFVKYGLTANRTQYFANGVSLAINADYQRAGKNLDTVEKISTGGINSWRQFAELPSLADTGLVVGAELRKRIPASESLSKWWVVDITPYTFVDVGRGKLNQKALSSDNHVKSIHAGLGLDATFKKDWVLSLTASHQNRDYEGVDAENETRLWAQLIKFF